MWIIVGQGPIALAVCAGLVCLDIFLSSILSLFFRCLWERARYILEILSQRAVKPKTTNQPNTVVSSMRTPVYSCYHVYSKFRTKMRIEVKTVI